MGRHTVAGNITVIRVLLAPLPGFFIIKQVLLPVERSTGLVHMAAATGRCRRAWP